jgi:hypothetical protein
MPAPSNYDDAGMLIRVDPNTLYSDATRDMVNEAKAVADALDDIAGIWNNLKLGWAGATAACRPAAGGRPLFSYVNWQIPHSP